MSLVHAGTTRSLGIGDVSLATAAARGIDHAATSRALHAALETGIELVDIAVDDDSERLVGETIRVLRLRDKAVAAPRVPALRTTPSGATTRDTLIDRLPPRYVTARVEAALRSTQLDAVPLAQLELRAAWRTSSAWPELVGTCARLVREGKVLAWGAYVEHTEEDTGELARESWLTSLAIPFSLCERTHVEAVFAAARAALEVPAQTTPQQEHLFAAGLSPDLVIAAGLPADLVLAAIPPSSTPASASAAPPKAARETPMAIYARRPLAGGALAGTLGPGAKLRQRDERNALSLEDLDRIAVAAAKLARFTKNPPPAARANDAAKAELERSIRSRPDLIHADSVAELALRYVITKGAIALPRLHRHEYVADSLVAAMGPPLPADLIEALEKLDT
jgi:aryl-alcohol dehydrogenase-like predicted oxidoreductase